MIQYNLEGPLKKFGIKIQKKNQIFADCLSLRLAVGKVATSAIRARPDPTAVAASMSAIRARPLPDPTASRGASPSPSASPSP